MSGNSTRDTLRRIGMDDAHVAALMEGKTVVFNLLDAAEGTLAVAQLVPARLRIGIYITKNDEGGLLNLLRFEARAQLAAKAVGATEVEISGFEITNEKLADVLRRGGFSATTMPAPDELGGGTFDGLSRVQPVD